MTRLFSKISGTLPAGDFLREAFDDGRLAHAGFAEQHGIVLRAAAKDLDDALDFVLAADDRVHVALARNFREVAAKRLQRGRFDFAFLFTSGSAGLFFAEGSPGGCSSPPWWAAKFGSSSFKISCRRCSMSTSR